MRLPGGIWDKLGHRYESLWTVDALLSVLRGEAVALTVEAHGPEGEGVEFYREFADGSREYLSAKRQTTSNVWSLAELTRPKETGRSILGDLLNRLGDKSSKNRAVFASGTSANKLLRLCEEAARADSAKTFQDAVRGNQDLANEVEKYVLNSLTLDWPDLWNRLRRLRVDSCTEDLLRRFIKRFVERDLVLTDGRPVTPTAARLVLYELAYASFGKRIERDDIVTHLAEEKLAPRDWAGPTPDHENLDRRNRLYAEDVEADLIRNVPIPRKEVATIIEALDVGTKTVVLAGGAGMGKSCVLAQCLRVLSEKNIPHLAIRLDAQTGAASAAAFGNDLGFSLSPTVVLSGVARGRSAVLVIDQLDALSTASGRNPRLWDLFRELLFEAKHFEHIRLLLACRAYDFDHDDRLRRLADKQTAALRINLEPLDIATVREILTAVGAPLDRFRPSHIELLRTPLHLSVFLQGEPTAAEPVTDLTQLYDRYWRRKREEARNHHPVPVRFEETVQRLAAALSDRQTLSAPRDVFDADGLAFDAEVLASEHIFVFEGDRCRFFHETFFDYTFARGFVASGKRLLPDLLPQGQEQHLFRRGQVRQVLAYQRGRDGGFPDYLAELGELFTTAGIRVHLKKAVLDWLSQLPNPTVEEWQVVAALFPDPQLGWFARTVPWNKPAWFPVLRDSGTLATWLGGTDAVMTNFTIRLLALPETIKVHSAAIAALIAPRLRDTPEWRERFAALCEFGEVYHSREFFDLFILKLREGWFDNRSGRDWYGLTHIAKGNAGYAGEFVAELLRRRYPGCVEEEDGLTTLAGTLGLHDHFFKELQKAEPLPALQNILPVFANVLRTNARTDDDGETHDPLSFCTSLDDPFRFGDSLMQYLVSATRRLAQSAPPELDALTSDLETLPNDSSAFLLEHAWSANGAYFADKAADYLSAARTRLAVRYSGGDSGPSVTRKLLRVIGPHLSNDALRKLEKAILAYRNDWECRNPEWRGHTEYALLLALPEVRLGKEAWHRLDGLRRKFGPMKFAEPAPSKAVFVGSPISLETARKMSDRQWLRAMRRYAADRVYEYGRRMRGGSIELGRVLEIVAQCDKQRFAKLLLSLPEDVAPTYFEHLLSGICKTAADTELKDKLPAGAFELLDTQTIAQCATRLHALLGKPCGKQICWSLRTISGRELPDSLLEIVGYYAQYDPDPQAEDWQPGAGNSPPMYGGDPHSHGINSVRGAAAETITHFLLDQPSRWSVLQPAVLSLVHDPSLAVRSCAVGCLHAWMRENRDEVVMLFLKLADGADAILDTFYMDHFLHYAAFSRYPVIRPLLRRMLTLEKGAREIAARQITVAAFRQEVATEDLRERVLRGDEICRAAAAGVFAHNLGQPEVAASCREHLRTLFHDPVEKVREQIDACWRELTAEQLVAERALIIDFINSPALPQGVGGLLHVLKECPERLPEEVLLIPERLLKERQRRTADSRDPLDFHFYEASELIMRLYQQSRAHRRDLDAAAFETRCLNLIDAMLPVDTGAMDSELNKLDQ